MIPLLLLAAAAFAAAPPVLEDHGYGPVDPVPVPNVWVTRHDGARVRLPELMRGRRTAVQFVFMDCQTACPLLGSLFQNVDRRLEKSENTTLVSITVNPERDTPERLSAWLRSFGASKRWNAVLADRDTLRQILEAFGQRTDGPPAGHSLQVFYIDREATYVARSLKLPQAPRVANALLGKVEMAGRAASGSEPPANLPLPTSNANPSGRALYHGGQALAARVGGDPIAPVAARCSNCHGENREGAPEGKIAPSSLDARSLTEARARRGGPPSAYTGESFCASLASGIDPAGVMLSSAMPRYELTKRECSALWEFLSSGK